MVWQKIQEPLTWDNHNYTTRRIKHLHYIVQSGTARTAHPHAAREFKKIICYKNTCSIADNQSYIHARHLNKKKKKQNKQLEAMDFWWLKQQFVRIQQTTVSDRISSRLPEDTYVKISNFSRHKINNAPHTGQATTRSKH